MVKIGFIVEGGCERIVLRSPAFSAYLRKHHFELVSDIVNLDGKGNLKASSLKMNTQVQVMRDSGATYVIVLRDLDDATSFAEVKQQVYQASDVHCCVAVKELEAWFLVDSTTLSLLFLTNFFFDYPEEPIKPFDTLNALRRQYTNRGISDKKGFASAMVNNGFTIEKAAQHPNCPSAHYFLTKLQTLASAN